MPAGPHFRAFSRRTVNLAATVAAAENREHPARLVDLALGGACVEVAAPLSVGDVVTLQVTAPNLWDPLLVPSAIAWTRPAGPGSTRAGLSFRHAEPSALPALVELLAAYRYE